MLKFITYVLSLSWLERHTSTPVTTSIPSIDWADCKSVTDGWKQAYHELLLLTPYQQYILSDEIASLALSFIYTCSVSR